MQKISLRNYLSRTIDQWFCFWGFHQFLFKNESVGKLEILGQFLSLKNSLWTVRLNKSNLLVFFEPSFFKFFDESFQKIFLKIEAAILESSRMVDDWGCDLWNLISKGKMLLALQSKFNLTGRTETFQSVFYNCLLQLLINLPFSHDIKLQTTLIYGFLWSNMLNCMVS